MDPKISVIIPLYNKAAIVGQTLKSLLSQTYSDFEVVVIDDGSTDASVDVVKSFEDTRIRIISQSNGGVSVARNRGIAEAKGEFVTFLDADDEWTPDYLAIQLSLMQRYPMCDIFVVNYEFSDSNGKKTSAIIRNLPFVDEDGILDNYFEVATYSHPPITSISIMVRKALMGEIGGFPVGIKSGEDLLTWARLACRGKIAFSKKVCAIYNLGEGYDFANQPPRRQDAGDPVGRELKKLYEEYPSADLKHYIGHWHKMRASVAIRYFERRECFVEACKSIRYFPNKKILPFFVMPIVPKIVLKKLFRLHR